MQVQTKDLISVNYNAVKIINIAKIKFSINQTKQIKYILK